MTLRDSFPSLARSWSVKSAGFGFIMFDSDKDAADFAAMESIHFAGVAVKIKQAAFEKCTSAALLGECYARTVWDLTSQFDGGFGNSGKRADTDLASGEFSSAWKKSIPLMKSVPLQMSRAYWTSEWLESDVLITRNGTILLQTTLGKLKKMIIMEMGVDPLPADSTDEEEESDKNSLLKSRWPCCYQDESECLGSDVLRTRSRTISSQSFLS